MFNSFHSQCSEPIQPQCTMLASDFSQASFITTHFHTITMPSFLLLCFKQTSSPSHTHISRGLSPLCSYSIATSCGRTLIEAPHPETITITFHIFRHDTFISRLLSGEQVGGNHIGLLLNGHIDIRAGCINCFMERWFNTRRLQFQPSPFGE